MSSSHLDPQLVDKIVHEVKSQGVFDDFRKDTLADVDTKPAYQNLRQRVENTVKKFLSEQKWTPETNKYQLRERLRRHITESGFLDVGVERIVDQVVNPKIGSVFQPRIEDIAYKYLGIPTPPQIKFEPPPPPLIHPLPPLPLNGTPLKVETCSLLPTDLEQVSPDSDKATVKSECKEDSLMDMDVDVDERPEDDYESPPFEPLVKCASPAPSFDGKQESVQDADMPAKRFPIAGERSVPHVGEDTGSRGGCADAPALDTETQDTSISLDTAEPDSEKEASRCFDAMATQESQLSQVSSDSRISTASRDQNISPSLESAAVNISEEAQMPKFSENSSEALDGQQPTSQLHFDIKKDEIKFEGTDRKANLLAPVAVEATFVQKESTATTNEQEDGVGTANGSSVNERESNLAVTGKTFQFEQVKLAAEAAACSTLIPEKSCGSSQEEPDSAQLNIVEKSITESTVLPDKKDMPHDDNSTAIVPQQQREKSEREASTRHSSSSFRHKKHSKHKRRSADKDSEKERERARDKDRGRSDRDKDRSREKYREKESDRSRDKRNSKHSSNSSSKHSSHKPMTDATQGNEKVSTNSAKQSALSSSSSSSSRSEVGNQLDAKRAGERRSELDKKAKGSSAYKENSSNSSASKKSGERKVAASIDDHNESRDKVHRRKSTDSNDEDKHSGGGAGARPTQRASSAAASTTANSKSKSANEADTNSQKGAPKGTQATEQSEQLQRNKIVILNDILQNPATNFINLEANAHVNYVQVVSSVTEPNLPQPEINSNVENVADCQDAACSNDLFFFEEINGQFTTRLQLLDTVMELNRKVVKSLSAAPSYDLYPSVGSEESFDACSRDGDDDGSGDVAAVGNTQATLLVDYIRYSDSNENMHFAAQLQASPRKRFKHNDDLGDIKISSTPSDVSLNSKENETFEKFAVDVSHKAVAGNERRDLTGLNKLNQQQRYTSEDLYKPRPLLTQRSRRRGVDSIV